MMGMSLTSSTGGGDNFQCFPHDPQYANFMDGRQYSTTGRGLVYGAEYQGDPDVIYDFDNFGGSTFLNQDIPCAMCHVLNRTSVLMIPGKTQCPLGWTEEYWGYLVSTVYIGGGRFGNLKLDSYDEGSLFIFA